MPSAIDATKPVSGSPTTQSVRDQFATAAAEITALQAAVAAAAPIASPAFTGNPTAPTPAPGDSDTSVATTAFVAAAPGAILTTRGDLLRRGPAAVERLPVGAPNGMLVTDGTDAIWGTLSTVLDAVIGSTRGMTLRRGASAWQALGVGAAGRLLTSDGTDPQWSFPAPHTQQGSGSNASTTSASAVMGGQAVVFTPTRSGATQVMLTTTALVSANLGQMTFAMRYGTGTAPVAGAAAVGTTFGPGASPQFGLSSNNYVITIPGFVTLTPGTAYWFDFYFASLTASVTATLANNFFNILEF